MNKKAQELSVGGLIIIAIVAIVGLILLTATAQYVGDVRNTVDVANETISSANGTTLALITQLQGKFITDIVVYNSTDDYVVTEGNWTLFNNQVIDGAETAGLNISANGDTQDGDWSISYTYQPTTYDANSGGRAVAGLIVIFFAIAIAIVMLVPTLRSKILESMRR